MRTFVHPDEAQRLIREAVGTLDAEEAPLSEAIDRILAAELTAFCDLPAFDNSAMDGYAVRAEDLRGASRETPVRLPLRDTIRAGRSGPSALGPGEAIKIMTGAPMPEGADSVVMKECASPAGDHVAFLLEPKPGENVRRRGEDVRRGAKLLVPGAVLRAYELALLASQGVSRPRVVRRPIVAVATSGDELVPYDQTPGPGRIRNSNGPALAGLLRRWGCEALECGIAPDDEEEIRALLARALKQADALLVTGGVSVGDYDLTHKVLSSLGFKTVFWKTAIKPGKPLLFGLLGSKPVFGLPGNPVSAIVCAEEFVRPALEKMRGQSGGPPSYHLRGRTVNAYSKPADRRQYVFCKVRREKEGFLLEVIRPQGSAMLGMASGANALAVAPIGVSRLEAGMELDFRWIK